jgi:hypothetical protein
MADEVLDIVKQIQIDVAVMAQNMEHRDNRLDGFDARLEKIEESITDIKDNYVPKKDYNRLVAILMLMVTTTLVWVLQAVLSNLMISGQVP